MTSAPAMRYFTDASGGLVSLDASGVVSRFTIRGQWVTADDLTAQSLKSLDWWPISDAEAVEIQRAIACMPRRV